MKLLFENWQKYLEENEDEKKSQTIETLLNKLKILLENWPACQDNPEGMACKYHEDLEKVVKEYSGEPATIEES